MNTKEIRDFFDALQLLETEKGIKSAYMIEKITNAIIIAVKKDYQVAESSINVNINPDLGKFEVSITKFIAEEVEDPQLQISMDAATKYVEHPVAGMPVTISLDTKQLGRIAAQNAKHVIRQGIHEAEHAQLLEHYQDKVGEIINCIVRKIDPVNGNATVEIDKYEFMLFKNEQLPGDNLKEGDRVLVYVVDVLAERRCTLKLSRTHKDFVKRLFEREVPEIFDGTVKVKAISREAGSRTKMAVWSENPNVDPIGSCIGPGGSRISAVVKELKGEKIDIVKYSEDDAEFITQALSPADVISVEILPGEERKCTVIVPDDKLSLAIGNKGQNAKLAAKLTGYKIDIRPESGILNTEKPAEPAAEPVSEEAETEPAAE